MIHFIIRNSWWAKRKRPKISIGFTIYDLIIEIAGFAALLALWIVLTVSYSGLPDVIPIHYNAAGQAVHFGGKSGILVLPVIATVVFAGMTILSRFPHVFNYPVRITEDNAFFQYSNMVKMLRCMKLAVVLLFGCIVIHTILYSAENDNSIGIWFILSLLAIIFIPLIYFLVKSIKYR